MFTLLHIFIDHRCRRANKSKKLRKSTDQELSHANSSSLRDNRTMQSIARANSSSMLAVSNAGYELSLFYNENSDSVLPVSQTTHSVAVVCSSYFYIYVIFSTNTSFLLRRSLALYILHDRAKICCLGKNYNTSALHNHYHHC